MTSVSLTKSDISIPWGFRLQGGKDFGSPLTVQRIRLLRSCKMTLSLQDLMYSHLMSLSFAMKINPGSVAARCGLQIGDVILSINDVSTAGLKHKDAQDLILQGEKSIQLVVNRNGGGSVLVPAPVEKNASRTPAFYDPPKRNTDGFGAGETSDNQPPRNYTKYFDPSAEPKHSDKEAVKYTPSSTCKLVRDNDAGNSGGVSALTGAPIRSSPAQSKLHHLLDQQCTVSDDTGKAKAGSLGGSTGGSATSVKAPQPQAPAPYSAPAARPAPATVQGSRVATNASPENTARKAPEPSAQNPQHTGNSEFIQKLSSVSRIPVCHVCNTTIVGQYMTAMGKIWCRQHFVCHSCGCSLLSEEFFEDNGNLYCRKDYENSFAPRCSKCEQPISEEVVNAMGKMFHVECFTCTKCNQPIQGGSFHLNHGQPYCQKDWDEMFQTKCHSCQFAIEPGDQWIEALNSHWHAECFNCCVCKKNLESVGFSNRNGFPCCKDHK